MKKRMKIIMKKRTTGTIILSIAVVLIIICLSFFNYFKDYYSYTDEYYETLEKCNKNNDNSDICAAVREIDTKKERFEKEDAITLYYEVTYLYFSPKMVLLFPLIIIVITVMVLHDNFSTGIVRNILMRQSLSDYKMVMNKKTEIISLLVPLSIVLIIVISCLITGFDFSIDNSVKLSALYDAWNYNHFIYYLIIHCIILYLLGVFYSNIACCYINKSKNKLIVILLSYITFFVIIIVIYAVYALIINKIGFSGLMNYFNVFDYWNIFAKTTNYFGLLLMSFFLASLSFAAKEILFINKEKVIIDNEK